MVSPKKTSSDSNIGKVGPDFQAGSCLGKYRLKRCIDKGGSCEVWEARDNIEGIWVALKIPLLDANGERDNKTLLREIRSVARLRHRNILSVKNADIIDGYAVLATELSTGTLANCSKPMSAARIIRIIAQVLEGLSYAHRHHIVHCDVTPNNIFLFPDKRAALGDFGISIKLKGRATTVADFGTPGYVAPEQAYGYPAYRSDCFSVGLVLYEYLTGVLPRWPFNWPPKGQRRLRNQTSLAFVSFMRKSLSVDPARRFANAGKMLSAMIEATPKALQKRAIVKSIDKKGDWQQMRRQGFVKRYRKVFAVTLRCVECKEPIAESMKICPWCGSGRNRFDCDSQFSHICGRCHKGVLPEWRFCPWCYGAGFASPSTSPTPGVRYQTKCKYCDGKLMRFMRYCPWCRRKVRQSPDVWPFPQRCGSCGWGVDTAYWNYCPWCAAGLK